MTDIRTLFSERQAHWTSQGFKGREVYDQLAADTYLPAQFQPADVAAICGLTTHAFTQRRFKGMKPDFIRISSNHVRYPRESICSWMAEMFISQKATA